MLVVLLGRVLFLWVYLVLFSGVVSRIFATDFALAFAFALGSGAAPLDDAEALYAGAFALTETVFG